jgi:two-component sensor histidine kinase
MITRYTLTTILFLIICINFSFAQNAEPLLLVKQEDEFNAALLLKNLKTSKPDSSRANLLIKISHIYWQKGKTEGLALDSCLNLAKQAYTLSKSLQFITGSNESAFMMCKIYMLRNKEYLALALLKNVNGEEYIRLVLTMADHYVVNSDSQPKVLEKAYPLIEHAQNLSIKIHSDRCLNECQIILGKYYFASKNIGSAKNILLKNIKLQQQLKKNEFEARTWNVMAHFIPENADSYKYLIYCHEMAINAYLRAGKKKEAAAELRDLAVVNTNHNHIELGGQQFRQAIADLEAIHEKVPRRHYYLLAEYYRFTGRYHLALRFGLIALQTPENYDDKRMLVYRSLAETYSKIGETQKALMYYQTLLDFQLKQQRELAYVTAYRMTHIQGEAGEPHKALVFFNLYTKSYPPKNLSQKQLFTSAYGDLYRLTGEYGKAETHYKEMLALNSLVKVENGKSLHGHEITIEGCGALFLMGRFYGERKRYYEAEKYLKMSLITPQFIDIGQEMETYKFLFKADSAKKNYLAAIKNFERHKLIFDSINSVTRNNQIADLSIRYETEQRKKDIKLLESIQKAQQAKLLREETIRKVILGGAAAFLALAILAFIAYRIKKRSNFKLHVQQGLINQKNTELQSLLLEKETFLKEKDWLLKEVHHRVKNNLQIVMSLLSTQSFYIQNDFAKEAILQSENRVQLR